MAYMHTEKQLPSCCCFITDKRRYFFCSFYPFAFSGSGRRHALGLRIFFSVDKKLAH